MKATTVTRLTATILRMVPLSSPLPLPAGAGAILPRSHRLLFAGTANIITTKTPGMGVFVALIPKMSGRTYNGSMLMSTYSPWLDQYLEDHDNSFVIENGF